MKAIIKTFALLIVTFTNYSSAQDRAADSIALLTIKAANHGSVIDTVNEILWDNVNGGQVTNAWRSGNSINRWKGVTVKNDRVTAISLPNCGMHSFPIASGALSELQTLVLLRNKFITFPAEIRHLKKLVLFSIAYNQLKSITDSVNELSSLRNLNLSNNQFIGIPQGIFGLASIDTLDMSDNQIVSIPQELFTLDSLKYLCLGSNHISVIPKEIGNLVNLHTLYMWDNKLTTLPTEFTNLVKLQNLSLSHNQFEQIDGAIIGKLLQLTRMELDHNKISSFPGNIDTMPKLKSLFINNNLITSLPPEIGKMKRLEYLNLDSNQLKTFPREIKEMSWLSDLTADYNQIDSIPPELGHVRLDYLSLIGNRLRTIPVNLNVNRRLYLQSNQISYLPESRTAIDWTWYGDAIEEIYLQNNNLTSLPQNITRLNEINIPYCDFSMNYLTVDSLLPEVVQWLDTTDKNWRYTQKKLVSLHSAKVAAGAIIPQCRFDKYGIHFNSNSFNGANVTIFDLSGRVIASGTITNNTFFLKNQNNCIVFVRINRPNSIVYKTLKIKCK
jgi:Leucine-rich repeat (LRR) protein